MSENKLALAFENKDLRSKTNELNAQIVAMFFGNEPECSICGGRLPENYVYTNRDWLNSLSPVELVNWIKNTAAAMSDADLLRWMEEKHEHR